MKNLKMMVSIILCIVLIATSTLLTFGIAVSYECECENIHIHTNKCYPLICETSHAHENDCYNYVDSEPVCGIAYKAHKVSCLSEQSFNEQTIFNSDKKTVDASMLNKGPYVFCEAHTYQSSGHRFYDASKPELPRSSRDTFPQLFLLGDYSGMKVGEKWASSPANKRWDSENPDDYNYVIGYCSDRSVEAKQHTMYRMINMEDSLYYGKEEAAYIRSLIYNTYPYKTIEEVQADLKAAGFDYYDEIGESEAIVATQFALWDFSNSEEFDFHNMKYWRTERSKRMTGISVNVNPTIGWHQFYVDIEDRVKEIAEYYVNRAKIAPMALEPEQIIVSSVEINDLSITPSGQKYCVDLSVKLNGGYEADDENTGIEIVATSEGADAARVEVTSETVYKLKLDNYTLGEDIKIVMSGSQELEKGVYFFQAYSEHPEDRRAASQNMVAMACGVFPVGEEITLEPVSMSVMKTDVDGQPLEGVELELYYDKDDEEDVKIGTYLTDEEGMVYWDNLISGAKYIIKETKPLPGYRNLVEPIEFKVTAGKDVVIEMINDANGVAEAEGMYMQIVNKPAYKPIAVALEGTKTLDGKSAGNFEFTLADENGVLQTVKSTAEGKINFKPLQYNEVGEHHYKIYEEKTSQEGITFDKRVYDVTVSLTEVDDELAAQVTYKVDGKIVDGLKFENKTSTVPLTSDMSAIDSYGVFTGILLLIMAAIYLSEKRLNVK